MIVVNDEFGKFGAIAGDIFYYAHASRKAGYSRIQIFKRYGAGYEIVFYTSKGCTWCLVNCCKRYTSTTIRITTTFKNRIAFAKNILILM